MRSGLPSKATLLLSLGALIALLAPHVSAAPGDLDPTFGTGGKVTTPIGSTNDQGNSVVVQSDGKIVVAGYSGVGGNNDIALVRYTASGALDTSFGTGGKVTTPIGSGNDRANSVAVQNDGKILVTQSGTAFALSRDCFSKE